MANIGNFGKTTAEPEAMGDPDTFTFYGVEFEVPARVPWVYIGEFSAAANETGIDAFSAAMRMIKGVIGKEQWPEFRDLAADNYASFDDLVEPCMAIINAVSERPTQQPSASADGLSATTPNLSVVSSSEESSDEAPKLETASDERLEGLETVEALLARAAK